MVSGAYDEINALELRFLSNSVHTVNMSVVAGLNVIFFQNVHNFAANKVAPNGREVEKGNNRLIRFAT